MDAVDCMGWNRETDSNPLRSSHSLISVFTSTNVSTRFQVASTPQFTTLKVSVLQRNNWVRKAIYSLAGTYISDFYDIIRDNLSDVDRYVLRYSNGLIIGLTTNEVIECIQSARQLK